MQLIMVITILVAILLAFLSYLMPKKLSVPLVVVGTIALTMYIIVRQSFFDALLPVSVMLIAYISFSETFDRDKRVKKEQLKKKVAIANVQVVEQNKDGRRIFVDSCLTILISSISIICLLFAPETYIVFKYLIGVHLLMMLAPFVNRVADYLFATIYVLPEEKEIVIISLFESRELPMRDLDDVKKESAPDVLRIHPMFTFLSEHRDYTKAFTTVLRLSFHGVIIYLTPSDPEWWYEQWRKDANEQKIEKVKRVYPLWHPKTIKRLLWKGYFVITVKGISAYTGLLFILIWLKTPWYGIVLFISIWWLFNLYIADQLLITATDATKVTEGELYVIAQEIFSRAGITKTKLYLIDSPIYNGLATGMNIGKGTIMLTTATANLSKSAVEAILAHEAIHIKKRDVLINQLARIIITAVIALCVYLFFDQIKLLADHFVLFMIFINIIMIAFMIYLSLIAQWTEIRADYYGARLLAGASTQMAEGLRELSLAQDGSINKALQYSTVDVKGAKDNSYTERGSWLFQFIEFTFLPHPPLYWRIHTLLENRSWRKTKQAWVNIRFKACLPNFCQRKSIHDKG